MRRTALAAMLLMAALAGAADARAAGAPLPPQGSPPPGANDFDCRPPAAHPYPVVLVHGTLANMTVSWNAIAPALERLHYCVFALDYGVSQTPGSFGRGDIPTSARQLETFVDRVLARTGARKVSIVGHSQGGMMPRYYMKFLGGAAKVDDLVGLSPSNHGTTNPLAPLVPDCLACRQQIAGSPFLRQLNAGDETPGPSSYTVIETRNDEVVTPFASEFLPKGSRVTNVLLQDRCPTDPTDHVGMIYDPTAVQWMLDALGRPGPADPRFAPACEDVNAPSRFPDSASVAPARVTLAITGARRLGPHRLRVTLRSRGGAVSGVRATLARARGRTLASARLTRLRGRRTLTLRPRTRLRKGSYVIRVSARSASGSTLRARRTVRLRRSRAR